MQLFALDNDLITPASMAKKNKSYHCPECNGIVFLRRGPHKKPHYYHRNKISHCRQSKKSLRHLQTQLYLFNLIPKGECIIECPFPSINRIADVAWQPKKIIFEIQCSSISKEEIESRSADYRSIGMEIVWILHDHRFNKKNLNAAEYALRHQTCYYTNISSLGTGLCYDQFEILKGFSRVFKGPPLPLALNQPIPLIHNNQKHPFLKITLEWPLHFKGDLLDQLQYAPSTTFKHLEKLYQKFQNKSLRFKALLCLQRLHHLLLKYFLTSACK